MKMGNFKYAFLMLRSKGTVCILCILFFATYQLFGSIEMLFSIYEDKKEITIVYIEASEKEENIKKYVESVSGVKYISRYQECTEEIQIGDYRAQVELIGIEKDFLQNQWGELSLEQMSEAMPYVIFEHQFYKNLKNEKGERISKTHWEKMKKESFEVKFSGGKEARIWNYIEDDLKKTSKVYTTLDGFSMLTAKEMTPLHNPSEDKQESEKQDISDNTLIGGITENREKWVVGIENGSVLRKIIHKLEKNGVSFTTESMEKEKEWKKKGENGKYRLTISGMFLFTGMLLVLFQERLWKAEHYVFIEYMQTCNKKNETMKKIYRYKNFIYLFGGIAGGVLCYFIKKSVYR